MPKGNGGRYLSYQQIIEFEPGGKSDIFRSRLGIESMRGKISEPLFQSGILRSAGEGADLFAALGEKFANEFFRGRMKSAGIGSACEAEKNRVHFRHGIKTSAGDRMAVGTFESCFGENGNRAAFRGTGAGGEAVGGFALEHKHDAGG